MSATGASQGPTPLRLVFVTGLSGAGKSTAMHALEDLQFWCVDNLPLPLLERLVELAQRSGGGLTRLAAVCDVRDPAVGSQLPALLDRLRAAGHTVDLLFLDADDAALSRRFAGTGRPHPLQDASTDLAAALQRERRSLQVLQERASVVLDTTLLNVHELRREVRARLGLGSDDPLAVAVVTFAYGQGLPAEASLLIDVRGLAGGESPDDGRADRVAQRLAELLAFLHPRAQREGRAYLSVGIGSVDGAGPAQRVAQGVLERLASHGIPVTLRASTPAIAR